MLMMAVPLVVLFIISVYAVKITEKRAGVRCGDDGKDVVVVTGTNSGKTMCYNLPALQMCLAEPAARALYLFPTKALAQDQLGKLEELIPGPQVRVATYDGDTPQTHRSGIRKQSHIVLTNPDMLHVGILPGHDHWARFFKALRLIVIDEMHVYRGVFRLERGERLAEVVAAVRMAPHPPADPDLRFLESAGGGSGAAAERQRRDVGDRGFADGERDADVAFSRARVSAELVLRYTRKRVEQGDLVKPESIESYRAGYTAKERRQIEQSLFKGKLLGRARQNAMELGVDVGVLDAVVMNGYRVRRLRFGSKRGRAGRGRRDGLAVFVAHDDPLEQFLVRKPETLLQARNESVGANPENPQILSQHLLCTAQERPISPSELERFGPKALDLAEDLDRSGELEFRAGMSFIRRSRPPALRVNLRGAGTTRCGSFSMDRNWARWIAGGDDFGSRGAIYLHRGATFLVTSDRAVDLGSARGDSEGEDGVRGRRAGQRDVTDMVTGYRKKSLYGDSCWGWRFGSPADDIRYDLRPVRFAAVERRTGPQHADWGNPRSGACADGGGAAFGGVRPGDLGSAWYTVFPDTMQPAIFVFDKTPGGVGLCERLFESAHRLGARGASAFGELRLRGGVSRLPVLPSLRSFERGVGQGGSDYRSFAVSAVSLREVLRPGRGRRQRSSPGTRPLASCAARSLRARRAGS
ncbi:hypothetical protein U1Q18_052107 [Sarracenia purpurea var. burkii]